MKRLISIIILILIVTSIILLGAWFFSRRTAEKAGTPKPTFREFLTGDTTTGLQPTAPDGTLSSVFVDDNLTTAPTTASTTTTIGTQVAQFTGSTTTPINTTTPNPGSGAQGGGSTQNPGSGAPGGATTVTTTTIDPTTQTPAPVPPSVPGPECSDADLNIAFTEGELAQLQALQNRFYAVSQTLHTDADVATETGNRDNFKAKVDKISRLYTQCQQYAPRIADARYQIRVPTPFWHNSAQDKDVFVAGSGPLDGTVELVHPNQLEALLDPLTYNQFIVNGNAGSLGGILTSTNSNYRDETLFGLRTLERSLRLNIW